MNEPRSEVARPTHGYLVSTQVVNQRLYVGEDTLGVRFIPHDHHVLHLQQRHTLGVGPEEQREIVFKKLKDFSQSAEFMFQLIFFYVRFKPLLFYFS